MAKAKIANSDPDLVYESVLPSIIGDIPAKIRADIREKAGTFHSHLIKRRKINELSSDPSVQTQAKKQYSLDPIVRFYLENKVPYSDAVAYAIKEYAAMSSEAQAWSMICLMLDEAFRITFIGDKRGVVLAENLLPLEVDEKHYVEASNAERELMDDYQFPRYDDTSVVEQRIALIKTLQEKDANFRAALEKAVTEGFEALRKVLVAEEVDEAGFQPK